MIALAVWSAAGWSRLSLSLFTLSLVHPAYTLLRVCVAGSRLVRDPAPFLLRCSSSRIVLSVDGLIVASLCSVVTMLFAGWNDLHLPPVFGKTAVGMYAVFCVGAIVVVQVSPGDD